jgi:hypothetical protein
LAVRPRRCQDERDCLACHFEGSYWNLPRCFFAADFIYLSVRTANFWLVCSSLILSQPRATSPSGVAVEGDFAGDLADEFAVQRVSVAEHQHVGLGVWSGLGGWIGLSGTEDAGAQGSGEGERAEF